LYVIIQEAMCELGSEALIRPEEEQQPQPMETDNVREKTCGLMVLVGILYSSFSFDLFCILGDFRRS